MPLLHLFLILTVVVVWGVNFVFVKICLVEMSPLTLCALRFILASIPVIFFIKRPNIPLKTLILYGWVMFGLQFGFLFWGLGIGMPAGLSSLLMQTQVFFSMFLAAYFLKETPKFWQILGALVSFGGIAIVAQHFDSHVTFLGCLLILAAALVWGVGNLIIKKTHQINMVALVVWGSFAASVPMTLLAFLIDGPHAVIGTIQNMSWTGAGSLAYVVYVSTWIGYGVWNWLLSRYPVGVIAPFTLLVPIVGIASSVLFFNEPLQSWKIFASTLVISGLIINIYGKKIFKYLSSNYQVRT